MEKKKMIRIGIIILICVLLLAGFNNYFKLYDQINGCERESIEYDINYTEYQLDPILISNYTEDGKISDINQNITQLNVSRIEFILSWKDDIKTNMSSNNENEENYDTFNLTIIQPNGTKYYNQSKFEYIEIEISFNTIPKNQTLDGDSINTVIDDNMNNGAIGNWTIKISTQSKGSVFGVLCFCPDRGNDWELTVEIFYYTGKLVRK